MLVSENLRLVSIGCSCINRFQMAFYAEDNPRAGLREQGAIFDWNISPPDATIGLMRLAKLGRLEATLRDRRSYGVVHDSLIVHRAFRGFHFYHEPDPRACLQDDARFGQFLSKTLHLAENFLSRDPVPVHLVWSNIQPNLKKNMLGVIGWEPFVLTAQRYLQMKSLGRALFGNDAGFTFVSRPGDVWQGLHGARDVTLVELARGDDYLGARDLLAPLFDRIVAGQAAR